MENYIIRIYRRGEELHQISGLVELVELGQQRPFTGFEELENILCAEHEKTKTRKNSSHLGMNIR